MNSSRRKTMSLEDDVKKNKLGTGHASNPQGAAINADDRAAEAVAAFPALMEDEHLGKVQDVVTILKNTFGPHVTIYKNPRPNRGKPFTGVKFATVSWPRRPVVVEKFWTPLENLGYTKEQVKLTGTGYVIRVSLK